ncbi:MAG TPA: hypothetical protein ENN99_11995 [Chloroflexi bacterium]|nr:hypothetical protein [Chloroflexota bacterium]
MTPNREPHILTVDLGTSDGKSALVSTTDRGAGWKFQHVPLHVLPNGGAEQNPPNWWDAIVTSWVTDNRDPGAIHYNEALIRFSGTNADKFPESVPCTEI